MAKYKRPFTDIVGDLVAMIPRTIKIDSVVQESPITITIGTTEVEVIPQRISACDVLYAQEGFLVPIGSFIYKIYSVDYENETMTVVPNFLTTEDPIDSGIVFDLYQAYFFHGTPITTNIELNGILNANLKTPFVWLWENFKETTQRDEMIERLVPGLELFGLTQPQLQQQQSTHDDLVRKCCVPMRRLMEALEALMYTRTDILFTDELEAEYEEYPKFGIMARTKGAEKHYMNDNLSGCGMMADWQLYWQEECKCPPPIPDPIPPDPLFRTLSGGSTRTLSDGEPRTVSA